MADDQSRMGAWPGRQDWFSRGWKECGCRPVVGRSVQRLLASRKSLDRWRAHVRPHRSIRAMAHRLRARLRTIYRSCPMKMLFSKTVISAVALVASAAGLGAQTIAITGGKVYPVSGPVIDGGTVLIVNGKITAVGTNV